MQDRFPQFCVSAPVAPLLILEQHSPQTISDVQPPTELQAICIAHASSVDGCIQQKQ
jgi:hypothetical protein